MRLRHVMSGPPHALHRSADRAVRRAPAEHERVRAVGIVDLEQRDVVRDPGHLCGAQSGHQVVVLGVVGDGAGHVGLLEAADPVLEPGRARDRPRTASVSGSRAYGMNSSSPTVANSIEMSGRSATPGSATARSRSPGRRHSGDITGVRYLSAIRSRFDRGMEDCAGVEAARTGTGLSEWRPNITISRSACSGFVGIPGRGAGALDVKDDQRQLEHDPEPDRLLFEHDARFRPRS